VIDTLKGHYNNIHHSAHRICLNNKEEENKQHNAAVTAPHNDER
jgi:hypothetical protein